MHDVTTDFARIAQDLQIRKVQVESVVTLLDEGNTVPFITRYRKERTGGLNEIVIRQIQARIASLRQLADRKQTILKSIEGQGKLTDELRAAIQAADNPKRLEDLYLPYKPKKRSLATTARERGLEPLALAVWNRDPAVANLPEVLPSMVNPEKELNTPEDVLAGVQHILAEQIAETADVRAAVRAILWDTGKLTTTKPENLAEGQGLEYKDYFQFTEPVRHIPPHRILAINRGEKEGPLKVKLEWQQEAVQQALFTGVGDRPPLLPLAEHPHAEFLKRVAEDALTRLLVPSLEREVRRELTDRAESHAVTVFARNLRSLLLQPPLRGRRVLAIDPGFRTGCKLAALDETGTLLEDGVIFPHQPQNKKADARAKLEALVRKHTIHVVAIGNGTACRETEELVSELIDVLSGKTPPAPPPEPVRAPQAAAAPQPPAEVPAPAATPEAPAALTAGTEPAPGATVTPPALPAAESSPEPGPALPEVLPSAITAEPAPTAVTTAPPEAVPSVSDPASAVAAMAVDTATAATLQPAPAQRAPEPVQAAAAAPEPPPPPREPYELAYVIVNEAGASVYSASEVGREEFPTFDATLRGTISIGRRLQDPLSELVKIDPQNIGVGLYQHDVSPRQLKDSLEAVVESSVNYVGVDLNTASVPLLRYVSGLNQLVARELVEYRKQNGPFRTRDQLLQVPGVGPARYVQAAGFLKIPDSENPLDKTWIHPESYAAAGQLLQELGYDTGALNDRQKTHELREKLRSLSPEEVAARLAVGVPTVRDILEALGRPGRDPREDLPKPIFRKGILRLEDLQPGMELKGTVLNVVDFGAFVDIGLKDSGLVHISQMANRYIKSPYDVVAVGDVVTVWVLTVDQPRRRVSLTMIKPGTPRRPVEKKQPRARQERGGRPPRGRRPGGPPQQQVATPAGTPATPGAPAAAQEPATAVAAASPPPPAQQRRGPPPRPQHSGPPRKPKRAVPKPKLSQAALEGKAPLRTFSELEALWEAKEQAPPPPVAQEPVHAEPGPESTG
jgi:uncharacterized protein